MRRKIVGKKFQRSRSIYAFYSTTITSDIVDFVNVGEREHWILGIVQ